MPRNHKASMVEGRRLMQRMLTLQLAGEEDAVMAQMNDVTDPVTVLTALKLSIFLASHVLTTAIPDKEARDKAVSAWMTLIEAEL